MSSPTPNPHRFIVPLKGVNTFCTFRDGEIVPENPLPMVGFKGHAIDPEFGWVAWIADDGKSIGRAHLDAVEGEGGFGPIPMPEGYKAGCLIFHEQVLFVGGNCGEEVIGRFDFSSPKPEWVPLEVPEWARQHGKSIDDLLLDGDRLIAVDNIVFPKYLLIYHVANPRYTNYLETRELPVHGTYEHIVCGALGPAHMALLSNTTSGYVGRHLHLSVYDRTALTYQCVMSVPRESRNQRERPSPRDWRDVEFHGTWLLVAAGKDGVGVLNLDVVAFPRESSVSESRECGQRCLAALKYQPLPPPLVEFAVTRVVPIPETRHYLAVVEDHDTVVMELP